MLLFTKPNLDVTKIKIISKGIKNKKTKEIVSNPFTLEAVIIFW